MDVDYDLIDLAKESDLQDNNNKIDILITTKSQRTSIAKMFMKHVYNLM